MRRQRSHCHERVTADIASTDEPRYPRQPLNDLTHVWIFVGANARFPSAVFRSRERAEEWIAGHRVSGALTRYPLDTVVYEWAIDNEYFTPKSDVQRSPGFIRAFSSAALDHSH